MGVVKKNIQFSLQEKHKHEYLCQLFHSFSDLQKLVVKTLSLSLMFYKMVIEMDIR